VFAFVAQKPITNCFAIKAKGAQGHGWLASKVDPQAVGY
jgi:hypothetical protein